MGRDLTYEQACDALERAVRFGMHPSLHGIRVLTRELGRPQKAFKVIQVTGTNGKGSTARMVHGILQAGGMKTAVFTSPKLLDYTEQIRIGDSDITPESFARAVTVVVAAAERCRGDLDEPLTEFELMTATALWAMREAGVEWGVLEVGMGGRWDATSVCKPDVAVVTSVGMDHAEHLGKTLRAVARDKAYVIKRGSRAVIGPGAAPWDDVFERRASARGASVLKVRECVAEKSAHANGACFSVRRLGDAPGKRARFDVLVEARPYLDLDLVGPSYQIENAACAVAAADLATGGSVDPATVRSAIHSLHNPGRFEVLRTGPLVLVDGAHNEAGARALATAVREWCPRGDLEVVLGMLQDKPHAAVVRALAPLASGFVVVAPHNDRARPADQLARIVRSEFSGPVRVQSSTAAALDDAVRAGRDSLVAGSLTTVAEAIAWHRRTVR